MQALFGALVLPDATFAFTSLTVSPLHFYIFNLGKYSGHTLGARFHVEYD